MKTIHFATASNFFKGELPDCDKVSLASPKTIRATVGEDMDWLEVMVVVPDDEPGFMVTALVFLNKVRDEGYYFRGLLDEQGYTQHFKFARDVFAALRNIADENKVELDIVVAGNVHARDDPEDFFYQMRSENLQWQKNIEPKVLDSSCIPEGVCCLECPYKEYRVDKPEQANGYCAYLGRGDWTTKLGFSLLWDDIKECRVNEN